MRLILHIGANKTGTTTLQTTLRAHARTLERVGILYPASSQHRINHSPLVCRFKPLDAMPRAFTSRRPHDGASLRRMGEECWREIVRQVRRSDAETCILSSEDFFGLQELEELAQLLRAQFDEIQVVAYVRAPHSQYLSQMQQRIKASGRINAPQDFRYRIQRRLSRHLDVFGNHVTVRPFDRSMLVRGCIVQDFLATALPTADDLEDEIQAQNRNESMSAETICIMQHLRRYGWPEGDVTHARERGHVMHVLQDLEQRSAQTTPRLKPGIAAKILQGHDADLEWLRERFGVAFDAPEAPWTERVDPEGWSSDRFVDILDVDRADVDRAHTELIKELASSAGSMRQVLRRLRRFVPHPVARLGRSPSRSSSRVS